MDKSIEREYQLGRIRDYAIRNGLAGERIGLIFEVGLAAISRLDRDEPRISTDPRTLPA